MSGLPAAVSEVIKTHFAGYKNEEPEKMEMAKGEVAYAGKKAGTIWK